MVVSFSMMFSFQLLTPCILKSVAASCTVEADHGGWQLDLPMVVEAVR
jgi:hypothetical protein